MLKLSISEIARITDARMHQISDPAIEVTGSVKIDNRKILAGDIFAAFVGEKVDAHKFADQAIEAGAVVVLGTRETSAPTLIVSDLLDAITKLAKYTLTRARELNPELVVVGVTGSAGKTSTKDLIGQILAEDGECVAPAGSHNNELGLPLTVLELTSSTKYLVLEMGARGIGHIRYLTEIARPDISVVLNIGTAHMGEFGGVENTFKAKSELVQALPANGRAILNADDFRVAKMQSLSAAPVIFFGESATAAVQAQAVSLDASGAAAFDLSVLPGLKTITGADIPAETVRVQLKLVGEHQVYNALAATAAALIAGVKLAQIAHVLAAATPVSPYRMSIHERRDGITVINDAYNANPDSMRSALKTLAHLGQQRRTIAVLGEMLELGPESASMHDEIGRLAVRLNISRLIAVGAGARPIHQGASLEGSFGDESHAVATVADAASMLKTIMKPGDVVLVKSSQAAGLFRLGEELITMELANQISKDGELPA